jgi:hypothetical protein
VVAEIYIELLAVATGMLRVHQRSNIAAQVIEGVRRTGKKGVFKRNESGIDSGISVWIRCLE